MIGAKSASVNVLTNMMSEKHPHEELSMITMATSSVMIILRRETAVLKSSLKTGAERAKEACTPR